uniref:Uncharacterized protein n=1 Tax=Arundo donax TaxID=35708 RepID=A0A0A8ZZ34_ARUDO
MDKLKGLINALKTTSDVWHFLNQKSGTIDYPLQNGGTIQIFILHSRYPPSRHCMASHHP